MNRLHLLPALPVLAFVLTGAVAPPAKIPSASPTASVASAALAARRHHRRTGERHNTTRPISDVSRANRAATLEPASRAFINAVQVYPFAEGLLFQVYAAPGRITDIALQPGEALVSVASGDTVRWVIGDTTSGAGADKRTHILIKPFAAGLATSLIITTDRRTYHLALSSNAGTAMAALSWTYPQDDLIALKRASAEGAAASPVASGLDIEQLSFGYAITGDKPDWRPLRAFDDGRQTFIEFPAPLAVGEAPPLFLVDRKGDAQLVNYRLRGRFYVVDRLFDTAELRLGTKHQDIVRITRRGTKANRRAS
ncbi:MAG: P-type conjugative transfer protein TrbG [Sphingomonas sp.]|jgi:type IV secretion system protein VirB9|uniref:P-type conjugative transfer protein TrbG n=1 Tax=Sphingomonas sp. TaxID=28214 RepID=UPI003562ACF2